MATIAEILQQFKTKVETEVGSKTNVTEFDPGEDGTFVFGKELKAKTSDAVFQAVEYVLKTIVPRYQPKRRRGSQVNDGADQQVVPGEDFNLY
jgi:hypothetical protein